MGGPLMNGVPSITLLYCGSSMHRYPAAGLLYPSLRAKGIKEDLEFVVWVTLYPQLLRFRSLDREDIPQGPHVG